MKFLIDRPAFVNDTYIEARVQEPKIVEFRSDVGLDHISRGWKPLDQEAVEALAKLGRKKEVVKLESVAQTRREAQTMAEVQHGKKSSRVDDDARPRVSSVPADLSDQAVRVTPAQR